MENKKIGLFVTGLEVGRFGRQVLPEADKGVWEVVVRFDGSHPADLQSGVITLLAADWLSVIQTPDVYRNTFHFLIEGQTISLEKAKRDILKYCYFRCNACHDVISPDTEQICKSCFTILCPTCFINGQGVCKSRSHQPYDLSKTF